jgi:hypothetical protein
MEQLATGSAVVVTVLQMISGPVPLCGTLAGHAEVAT